MELRHGPVQAVERCRRALSKGVFSSDLSRDTPKSGCPPTERASGSCRQANAPRPGKPSCNALRKPSKIQQVLGTMKVIYDRETDTLSIILRPGKVAESDEVREGLVFDYDRAGRNLSIEMLDASDQVRRPQSAGFA